MLPRNDQGATKAPRLGLQATIFKKINTNQSRRYDGTKTRPARDSHMKKKVTQNRCSCDEGTKIRPASELHSGFIKAQQQR